MMQKRKKIEDFEIWRWRRMERINLMERKTNEEVVITVTEKRIFVDMIKGSHCKMIVYSPRHPEELHNLMLEGMIEGKMTAGSP